MNMSRRFALRDFFVAAAITVTAGQVQQALAQQTEETVVKRHIVVSQADTAAAANVKSSFYHVTAANVAGAADRAAALNAENDRRVAETFGVAEAQPEASTNTLAAPFYYPGDLTKGAGPTLVTTIFHALYVNLTGTVATNWGNPEGFLTDLGKSTFVHLLDQYTGSTATNRYTVGGNAAINYSFYGNVLYEHEIYAIVHAGALKYGHGAGHLYHVFLPKGVDTCFDFSGGCYSPDNPATWAFCGYHDAVNFTDIGLVFFSVEPYQAVPGCAVQTPNPNSFLADSTNSVLSHETFEAITDPIPGMGYVNRTALSAGGAEIGDECEPMANSLGEFLVPTFPINGKKYEVQLEYSDTYHACAAQP